MLCASDCADECHDVGASRHISGCSGNTVLSHILDPLNVDDDDNDETVCRSSRER